VYIVHGELGRVIAHEYCFCEAPESPPPRTVAIANRNFANEEALACVLSFAINFAMDYMRYIRVLSSVQSHG
jgi:hypothetical protein